MDEVTKHDSNSLAQIISEGLEKIHEICTRRNKAMPSKLILISDNTVREVKNIHCVAYLQSLVSLRKMRMCAMLFLRKSHTHCRLDQIFGVLARRVANTDQLLNCDDACNLLSQELHRPGLRAWFGATTEVSVSKLNAALDRKNNFQCLGASVTGGLLVDATANHVFMFMQEKGPWLKTCFRVVCFLEPIPRLN